MWRPNGGKTFWLCVAAIVLAIVAAAAQPQQQQQQQQQPAQEQLAQSKVNVVKRVFELLANLEQSAELNASTKFSALLSEFIIKQNVRFFQPTRYEAQIYYRFLHKLDALLRKNVSFDENELQREVLENIFQRQVRLTPTALNYGQLDANLEYESLATQYDQLVDQGAPNSTTSDLCLAALVTMRGCDLNVDCLRIILTPEPTYGYHRMHQILLLYVLMHHKCSTAYGTSLTYELLAKGHCTAAYREQNVIRSLGTPAKYRDLYLEQIVICGLFGFNEFVNWRNVVELQSWPNERGCYCAAIDNNNSNNNNNNNINNNNTLDCQCTNHLNSLALVYYINALLLLN